MKIVTIASLILLCSSASWAHFTLDYPKTRGFNEGTEHNAQCGGFNTVSARAQFPINDGFLVIDSHHPKAQVKVNVVYGNNPSSADFTAATATPVSTVSLSQPGQSCLRFRIDSPRAVNGANATIQVVYDGGDSPLYQCSDVTLSSAPSTLDQSTCRTERGSHKGNAGTSLSGKQSTAALAGLLATAFFVL
ncbi:hypothetical protein BGZ94_008365 [Podila epigama]|nr:hypothetical protein BGZ94_008365 [Podila epigama]